MAIEVTKLIRVFNFKKDGKYVDLADPNPDMSSLEVMKFYAGTHPELTNGFIEGPVVVNDKAVYKMTTKAGILG